MTNQDANTREGSMRRIASRLVAVVLVGTGMAGGYALRAAMAPESGRTTVQIPAANGQKQAQVYTCSMHPQIRQPAPGLCPICGMELIPVAGGEDEEVRPRAFVISEAAKALMDIQTARVERRFVESEIRMVGKVDYDETRLATISAWVPGRIDRLYADYTGIRVDKGDHMVSLYSPELLTAQQELRAAAAAS